jgi:hypothetical protein
MFVSNVVANTVTTNLWRFKGNSSNPLAVDVEELGVPC